jgi:hypothetical protein
MHKTMFKQMRFSHQIFTVVRKAISVVILAAFTSTSVNFEPVYAQSAQQGMVPFMSQPGVMVHLSPEFTPAYLKGIVIHPENALKFDFIIYKGDIPLSDSQKKEEYTKLTKYFLASLAIPDDDQWVNLSPYEKDRIIKDDFGKTEMGSDLLAQDYMLKQITASLIYPEDNLGKKFWEKVYAQAQEQFGTTNIPVNTFNKVWILPDDALIYEKGNTAYVLKNHLRVMLEEDYLSLQKHSAIRSNSPPLVGGARGGGNNTHSLGSQIIRSIVLPALEKEVNEGKNFAPLRQVYSGMLLAAWYKRALKESFLSKIYANKAKIKGVGYSNMSSPNASGPHTGHSQLFVGDPQYIYQQYLKAYKKGVFNFIKEDVDKYTNETIPRKYFSGGTGSFAMASEVFDRAVVATTRDEALGGRAMAGDELEDDYVAETLKVATAATNTGGVEDQAMRSSSLTESNLPEKVEEVKGKLRHAERIADIVDILLMFERDVKSSGLMNFEELKMFGNVFRDFNQILIPHRIILERGDDKRLFLIYKILRTDVYRGKRAPINIYVGKLLNGGIKKDRHVGETFTGILKPYSILYADRTNLLAGQYFNEVRTKRSPHFVREDQPFVDSLMRVQLNLLVRDFEGKQREAIAASINSYNTFFYLGQHVRREGRIDNTNVDVSREQKINDVFALIHSDDPEFGLSFIILYAVIDVKNHGYQNNNRYWDILCGMARSKDKQRVLGWLNELVESEDSEQRIRRDSERYYPMLAAEAPVQYFTKIVPTAVRHQEPQVETSDSFSFLRKLAQWANRRAFRSRRDISVVAPQVPEAVPIPRPASVSIPSDVAPSHEPDQIEATVAYDQSEELRINNFAEQRTELRNIFENREFIEDLVLQARDSADDPYQSIIESILYLINAEDLEGFSLRDLQAMILDVMKEIDYFKKYASFRAYFNSVKASATSTFQRPDKKPAPVVTSGEPVEFELSILQGGSYINSSGDINAKDVRERIVRFCRTYDLVEKRLLPRKALDPYNQRDFSKIFRIDLKGSRAVYIRVFDENKILIVHGKICRCKRWHRSVRENYGR